MKRSLVRPFIMLGTQPIVQALAVYMAYLYGMYVLSKPDFLLKIDTLLSMPRFSALFAAPSVLANLDPRLFVDSVLRNYAASSTAHLETVMLIIEFSGSMYLVLSTYPGLWAIVYHESIGIGGLNYISLGVGFFLGSQICAPINDRLYRRLKKSNNNTGRPEFRVPLMVPGSLLVPIGLFIYGWSAQKHTHWIVPNIGAAMFAAGVIIGFQGIQTYIVDSYTRFAASALAAITVLRSLAGFGFPLFAPYMYNALEYGWGNSLLGFIAIGLGLPAPFLLWYFGQKLRARSTFAAGGD